MAELTQHQRAAQEMLEAVDTFMSGADLTEDQRTLSDAAHKAGCYAAAAYDAHVPKSGGECHSMTRAFLLALVDPLSPELDYLRAQPEAGAEAREERQNKSH